MTLTVSSTPSLHTTATLRGTGSINSHAAYLHKSTRDQTQPDSQFLSTYLFIPKKLNEWRKG